MALCFFDQLKTRPSWLLLLLSTGSLSLLRLFFAVLNWVYISFFRPAKNLKKYGSWALVTGLIDGIGRVSAFQLARKGLNLVLAGRNPSTLEEVSESIRSKYTNIQIKTVMVDFSGDIDEGITNKERTASSQVAIANIVEERTTGGPSKTLVRCNALIPCLCRT